jgi:hypothetical protein
LTAKLAFGAMNRVNGIGNWLVLDVGLLALAITTLPSSRAQNPEDMRRAFIDIHDDKIPHNCEHAAAWLFKYREELKEDLLDELYRTDPQGRDVILHILFNTGSFTPDERFLRFVVMRLPEKDTFYPTTRKLGPILTIISIVLSRCSKNRLRK